VDGFHRGLRAGFQRFVQMDADFSHDPRDLPRFFAALDDGFDVVIGSRNAPGGSVEGWGAGRHVLSKGGSIYARAVLGVAVSDLTAGYKALSRRALELIDLDRVRSNGYSFQIEMTYRALRLGLGVTEIPVVFVDRRAGRSKMDARIFLEAVGVVWRLRLAALYDRL
jgi:dolichol-phosphate mannosyltransferase